MVFLDKEHAAGMLNTEHCTVILVIHILESLSTVFSLVTCTKTITHTYVLRLLLAMKTDLDNEGEACWNK